MAAAATVLAGIGVARAADVPKSAVAHAITPPAVSSTRVVTDAAFVQNHSVTVRVPGSTRMVTAVNPATFNSRFSVAATQAAIDAQATSAVTLSASDYQQAEQAFGTTLSQNSSGSSVSTAATNQSSGSSTIELAATHKAKITIYRWELESLAWYEILMGGSSAVGGMVLTLFGVTALVGVILGAIGIAQGIAGNALLWYADAHFPSSKTITITW